MQATGKGNHTISDNERGKLMKKAVYLFCLLVLIGFCSAGAMEPDFAVESLSESGDMSLSATETDGQLAASETVWETLQCDESYTLSYADGVLTASTKEASSYKSFIVLPLTLQEGHTYKVSFELRMVSHGGGKNTKAYVNPCWSFDGTGSLSSTDGIRHLAPGMNLGISNTFTSYETQLTVDVLNSKSNMTFSLYTNPVKYRNQTVTAPTYEIKNLVVSERIDIFYESGSDCILKEGATELPTTVGVYPNAAQTRVKLSSLPMPYEAVDERWYIDSEKPWTDRYGNEYSVGEEIDLSAFDEPLVLTPNLKTAYATHTVTFDSTGLLSAPNGRKVVDGDTVLLTGSDASAREVGMRFCGWAVEKDAQVGMTELIVTEDVTLYPIIGKNYDFAYSDAYDGLTLTGATSVKKDNMLAAVDAGKGTYLTLGNLNLSTVEYKSIRILFDAYSSEEAGERFVPAFASAFEGLYINTGFSHKADGTVKKLSGTELCSAESVEENGKAYLALTVAAHKSEYWYGTLNYMRIDPCADGVDFAIRRIEFIPYDTFAETALTFVGFEEPKTGNAATRAEALECAEKIAQVTDIRWTPALLPGNVFDSETEYTCEITVKPNRDFGKMFADGTTVSVNGKTFSPRKSEDGSLSFEMSFEKTEYKKKYSVTFASDGLRADSVPSAVAVFEDSPFYVSMYNTAYSADTELRFNGWSTDKSETDWRKALDVVTCEADMTLYPILSYDINLSCTANRENWAFNNAVGTFTEDGCMLVTQSGTSTDVMAYKSGVSIRTELFVGIKIYYHPEIFNTKLDVIYFCRAGEGASTQRYLRGTNRGIDPETGYNLVEYSAIGADNWSGILTTIRFDFFDGTGSTAVKAIAFEYPETMAATEFEVSGIQTPVTGKEDKSALSVREVSGTACTFDRIEWSPALRDGRFEENTVYTATVYLSPNSGHRFDPEAKPTMTFGETVSPASVGTDGKLYASFEFEKTEAYVPFSMTVEGESSFYVDGKARTYRALFDAEIPDEGVAWTVNDTESFAVDSNGVLTMLKNVATTVTLRATSLYNPDVYAETEIETLLYDFAFEIAGPDTISLAQRTVQYTVVLTAGDVYDKTVTWTVDNACGSVDPTTGRLTPRKNGTVLLTAVSNYNPLVYATLSVTFENQGDLCRLSFHPGTTDAVTNLPTEMLDRGRVSLENLQEPKREGYLFMGWAADDESFKPVSSVNLYEDTEVYAVWAKGTVYTFGTNGNTGSNGADEQENYIEAVCAGYGYWRLPLNNLSVNPQTVTTVIVRSSCEEPTDTRVYYKSKYTNANGQQVKIGYDTDSYLYAEKQAVGDTVKGNGIGEFESMIHNMSRHSSESPGLWSKADTITDLYIDICKTYGAAFRLRYIALIDARRTLTFDAGTEEAVSGMPETREVFQGDTVTVKEKPTRDGYVFVGWAKKPGDIDGVKDLFGIVDDLTLYAVWNKAFDCDSADKGDTSTVHIGTVDPAADGEALLILLSRKGVYTIELTYTDAKGIGQTIKAKSLQNGYAVIGLEGLGVIQDAELSVGNGNTFGSVCVTSYAYALRKQSYVESPKKNESTVSSVVGKPYEYSSVVETIENTNAPYELGDTEDEENETEISEFGPFRKTVTGRIPFTDVKTVHWFRNEVITAYRLGLVQGKTEDTFDPEGDVTVAEALTLAVRLNHIYYGADETFPVEDGEEWYMPYVRAAEKAGILTNVSFESYDAPALRRQVAVIMKNALPDSYLSLINRFASIPDVPRSDPNFVAILRMYNAGILQGSDSEYRFFPDSRITRAEMAAVVNRMALPENRKRNMTEKERLSLVKTYTADQLYAYASLIHCESDTFELQADGVFAEATTRDPIVFFNDLLSDFNGASISEIRVYLKWDTEALENPAEGACRLYFTTQEQPKWMIANRIDGAWDGTFDDEGFAELVFDCASVEAFQTVVKNLRFDPFEEKTSFVIGKVIVQKNG